MRSIGTVTIFLVSVSVLGCGGGPGDYPDIGSVYGYVTMDGKPLANASVSFQPDEAGGRPSSATTDESGYYELRYSASMDGAKVGKHTVRISTYASTMADGEGGQTAGTPETVPNRYNTQSELTKNVEPGSNEFDFELTSDGTIDTHDGEDYSG